MHACWRGESVVVMVGMCVVQATYDEIKRVIKEASQSDQLKEYIAYTEDQVSTRVFGFPLNL